MKAQLKEFEKKALKLPISERAALAAQLIASLDKIDEKENEGLWIEEADRRYNAYKQGQISARPAKEAIRDARLKLKSNCNSCCNAS